MEKAKHNFYVITYPGKTNSFYNLTAVKPEISNFLDLIHMTDTRLEDYSPRYRKSDIPNIRQKMKEEVDKYYKDFANISVHSPWCNLFNSKEPWGIDERCTYSGAYILRKKIKEGLSFEEAMQYLIVENLL